MHLQLLPTPLLFRIPSLRTPSGARYPTEVALASGLTPSTADAHARSVASCIVLLPGLEGLSATVRLGDLQRVDARGPGLDLHLTAVVVVDVVAMAGVVL